MIIDPVYEGKSMAGLVDLVTSGEIGRDSTVLYAHLGGQPALNAYASLFPGEPACADAARGRSAGRGRDHSIPRVLNRPDLDTLGIEGSRP